MIDLHTHTRNSVDGRSSMDDYCRQILSVREPGSVGTDIICFTDHLDSNPADIGYHKYDANAYFDEFFSIKDKYAEYEADGSLLLLSGVEFGEPHLYPDEFDKIRRLPYDMIMGSIHFFWGDVFISQMVREGYPVREAFKRYYDEVYKAVSTGGFDVLSHMDFPKRYFREEYYEPDVIEAIFAEMRKNNIIPEINTSSLRHGLTETLPGSGILAIYEKTGGRRVTVGADAHSAEQYAMFNDEAFAVMRGRFECVVFVGRKVARDYNPATEW